MQPPLLPSADEMYRACVARDTSYEGIFFTAVKTTGIFCRPSCPAKKPLRENVEFFRTAQEALQQGYRPCKRCTPLEPEGGMPSGIRGLLDALEADPTLRLKDHDLRLRGLDPTGVRRWFKKHYGTTFHAYQRAFRLGHALHHLTLGHTVTGTAYDSGYDSLSGFQAAMHQLTGRSPSQNRDTVIVHLGRVLTPLGPMLAGTTTEGVCLLEFLDRRMLRTQLVRLAKRWNSTFVPGPSPIQHQLAAELAAYFAGDLRSFTVPITTPGTPFQQQVWDALRAVPYGQTYAYRDLARRIGNPNAVRAVARANGDNRIALLIPCHRIIGADGHLTGYGGGLWRKRWLLNHEEAHAANNGAHTQHTHRVSS